MKLDLRQKNKTETQNTRQQVIVKLRQKNWVQPF